MIIIFLKQFYNKFKKKIITDFNLKFKSITEIILLPTNNI